MCVVCVCVVCAVYGVWCVVCCNVRCVIREKTAAYWCQSISELKRDHPTKVCGCVWCVVLCVVCGVWCVWCVVCGVLGVIREKTAAYWCQSISELKRDHPTKVCGCVCGVCVCGVCGVRCVVCGVLQCAVCD